MIPPFTGHREVDIQTQPPRFVNIAASHRQVGLRILFYCIMTVPLVTWGRWKGRSHLRILISLEILTILLVRENKTNFFIIGDCSFINFK